jgi:hypothetical protein
MVVRLMTRHSLNQEFEIVVVARVMPAPVYNSLRPALWRFEGSAFRPPAAALRSAL